MGKRTRRKTLQSSQLLKKRVTSSSSSPKKSPSLSSKKGKWTPEEDKLLSSLVKHYNSRNWRTISKNIPGRSQIQCQHRWTKILQPGLVKGPWTPQEDQKLSEWVKKHGATKWTLCAEGIPGRSGKQCREHWNNSLNPEVKKGSWSCEEDFLIMVFYKKYGGSWKKIIPIFKKRTENSIKNRFFSQLRKIASSFIQSKEKKFSAKIKLKTLLDYLGIATEKAREKLLKERPMNDSELEIFIDGYDVKLKKMVQMKKEVKNNNKNNNINNNSNNNNTDENVNLNNNSVNNDILNDEKEDSVSNNVPSINENNNGNNGENNILRKSNNISNNIFNTSTSMTTNNNNSINTNLIGNNTTGCFNVLASLRSNETGNFNNFGGFGFQTQISNLSNASYSALHLQEKPTNVNINNNITLNIKINQNNNNNNNSKFEKNDSSYKKYPTIMAKGLSKEITNNNVDINNLQKEILEKCDNPEIFMSIDNEELFDNESNMEDNFDGGYYKKPSNTGFNGGRVFNNEIPNSSKWQRKVSRQIKKNDDNIGDNNQNIK